MKKLINLKFLKFMKFISLKKYTNHPGTHYINSGALFLFGDGLLLIPNKNAMVICLRSKFLKLK